MERVLNKFKVGRMNGILQQFNVERPAGVKREGKAALIVKSVPRDQLLKLFDSPEEQEEPKTKRVKSSKASTQPIGRLDAFFGQGGSAGTEEVAQPGAAARQNDIKTCEENREGDNNDAPQEPIGSIEARPIATDLDLIQRGCYP